MARVLNRNPAINPMWTTFATIVADVLSDIFASDVAVLQCAVFDLDSLFIYCREKEYIANFIVC